MQFTDDRAKAGSSYLAPLKWRSWRGRGWGREGGRGERGTETGFRIRLAIMPPKPAATEMANKALVWRVPANTEMATKALVWRVPADTGMAYKAREWRVSQQTQKWRIKPGCGVCPSRLRNGE